MRESRRRRRRRRKEDGVGVGVVPPPLGGAVMQFLSVSRVWACAGKGRCSSLLIGIKDAQGSDMRVGDWRNSHQHWGLRGG